MINILYSSDLDKLCAVPGHAERHGHVGSLQCTVKCMHPTQAMARIIPLGFVHREDGRMLEKM